jgi:hypothetical protein
MSAPGAAIATTDTPRTRTPTNSLAATRARSAQID